MPQSVHECGQSVLFFEVDLFFLDKSYLDLAAALLIWLSQSDRQPDQLHIIFFQCIQIAELFIYEGESFILKQTAVLD